MSQERIKVSLDFGSSIVEVGKLIEQNQQIYFRFEPSFLESDLDISTFKLKKTTEISIIVRLQGTNAVEAKKIIDDSGLNVHSAVQLQEAADLVKQVLS